MSATEQMRAMLDQLMGSRDEGKRSKFHFSDANICKSFLLECCPHELLASTRMDLGECSKVHELALRADYQKAAKNKEYYYELDALEHLEAFVADADRRTEHAKKRLAETQEELSTDASEKLQRVHELAEMIGKKLAAAEAAGNEGNVEESLKLMEEVEKIKKEKNYAENDYRNSIPTSSYQQQKLRVCEVCSAYLGIADNDRRLADHFGGKLHLGFITIREKLEELRALVSERRSNGVYAKRRFSGDEDDDGPSGQTSKQSSRGVGGNSSGRNDNRWRDRRRDRDFGDRRNRGTSGSGQRRRSRSRSGSPRRDRGSRDGRRDDRGTRREEGGRERSHRDGREDGGSSYRNGDRF